MIGLEVHAQLSTKSKAYTGDSTEYGNPPNTNVSPISLGHPGTLPRLNENNINYAIKLGLATQSNIREKNEFARKNYFYADLPKGYQITQDKTPICEGGFISLFPNTDQEKKINLTRIHLEEDAGKSIHDQDPFCSLIDLNRAGVSLVEIVSEPDIRSSDEAYEYLTQVRKLVRYLDICDGNMEEGSLRCDANVSVRLKGSKEFGQRTETKNMNSIRNVKRAIEHEIKRQIDVIESGGTIDMETRSFNATDGTTFTLRSKEEAHDYRYFPEPDLQPVSVSQALIQEIQTELPLLPNALYKRYTNEYGLSEYDANLIIDDKSLALYFNELVKHTTNFKAAANWLNGAIKSYLNENGMHIEAFPIDAEKIAALIALIDAKKISHSAASQKVFPILVTESDASPLEIAERNNLIQESNDDAIAGYINEIIHQNPEEVERYKGGEKQLTGFFMGQLMRVSKGKADPKKANKLLREMLEQ